jgi:UDP-N-acetylglucosamine 4,6-dehydratase/5-epimerase
MMEKLMLAKARLSTSGTVFCGVRYGNVMYSRGSVFPLFVEQIKLGKPLTITHPEMTRYLLPLPVAIELVLFALEHGTNGDLLVRKAPAATVHDMAEATARIFGYKKGIKNIGIREGEKMHETLVTREELMKAEEYDQYYRVHNLGEINYSKYFSEGDSQPVPAEDYTSENAQRLTLAETEAMIRDLKEIKAELGQC